MPANSMPEKRTLAIDIGGTKFSIASFDGDRMVRRESRRTDAEGGREWMLDQIATIARAWQAETPATVAASASAARSSSTSSASRFPRTSAAGAISGSPDWVRELLGVPAIMDNDANVGALGEARFGAGPRLVAAVLHDAFHRHRRRHIRRWPHLARRGFLRRRDRPPDHPARRSTSACAAGTAASSACAAACGWRAITVRRRRS